MLTQTLLQRQFNFANDIRSLLNYAFAYGFHMSLKECLRAPEMEKIYKDEGKSWLTNPADDYHLYSLAFDICFFVGNDWIQDYVSLKVLGNYWTSLRQGNVWGGDWSVRDLLHFQGV